MTLVLMASASTQTALSGVNVPWDTLWTLVASDVKVISHTVTLSLLILIFLLSVSLSHLQPELSLTLTVTVQLSSLQTLTSATLAIPAATAHAPMSSVALSVRARMALSPGP